MKHDNPIIDKRVYSNMMRAGQRTYFFDVKINRNDNYYLVITESRKNIDAQGNISFDKHRIQLYHENVEEFSRLIQEMSEYLLANNPQFTYNTNKDNQEV